MPKFSKKKGRKNLRKTRFLQMRTLFKGGADPITIQQRETQLSANPADFYEHPIFNTDSYKVSMSVQYPAGTTNVYSYIEAREYGAYSHTVFFGLQAYIKRYLMKPLTLEQLEKAKEVWTAHQVPFSLELYESWKIVIDEYNGYLPVIIKAPLEGTVIPIGLPLVSIENTDERLYWLTTWLETSLLRAVWYPTTVATQSKSMKNVFKQIYFNCFGESYTNETFENDIKFNLHDFGARGVSSNESAGLGGAAHLVNFKGTDTFAGALTIQNYYEATIGNDLLATAVPASEHSTMTSWGRDTSGDTSVLTIDTNGTCNVDGIQKTYPAETTALLEKLFETDPNEKKYEGESAAYANKLLAYPEIVASVVSDSYDIYNAVYTIWGNELKPLILARRETNQTPLAKFGINNVIPPSLVIRPDSGEPLIICCRLMVLLYLAFCNDAQGKQTWLYEPVEDYVRYNGVKVLQGDGVDEDSVTNILKAITTGSSDEYWNGITVEDSDGIKYNTFKDIIKMKDEETSYKSDILKEFFSAETIEDTMKKIKDIKWDPRNIGFGMGGALLQKVNRDTQRWAMKCSSITINGKSRDVTKDPVTDPGKKSKTGKVALYSYNSGFCYNTPDNKYLTVDRFGHVIQVSIETSSDPTPIFEIKYELAKGEKTPKAIYEAFNDIRSRSIINLGDTKTTFKFTKKEIKEAKAEAKAAEAKAAAEVAVAEVAVAEVAVAPV
jgi:nicotinamide phosphoribosyltransferase